MGAAAAPVAASVISTGANLYHDLHFDLGLPLYRGGAEVARRLILEGIERAKG